MIEEVEGTYPGGGGLELFYRRWRDGAAPARGTLINVHGLGDHSALYPTVPAYFAPRGWQVYGPDLRGNGRSPGQRAYIERWDDLRGDVRGMVARARAESPAGPLFLFGHSLGGLAVLDYALAHPDDVAGVAASAPVLGSIGVPPVRMLLARVLSRVWPRFSLQAGLNLNNLSRDPEAAQLVTGDPLFHRWGTARLGTEVLATIERVHRRARELAVPVLLLHGSADRMVSPDGTRALAQRLAGMDAEFHEYPDAYHSLVNDLDAPRVLADLERWMEGHAGQR